MRKQINKFVHVTSIDENCRNCQYLELRDSEIKGILRFNQVYEGENVNEK